MEDRRLRKNDKQQVQVTDSLIGAEEPGLVEGLLAACEEGRGASELMPRAQAQARQPAQALPSIIGCMDGQHHLAGSKPVRRKPASAVVLGRAQDIPGQLCVIDDHHRLRSREVLRSRAQSGLCQPLSGPHDNNSTAQSRIAKSCAIP